MTKQTTGRMSDETKKIFTPVQKKQKRGLFFGIVSLCAILGFSLGAGLAALMTTTAFASDIEPPQVVTVQAEETIIPEPEMPEPVAYEPTLHEPVFYEPDLCEPIPDEPVYYEPCIEEYTEYTEYTEPEIFIPVLQRPVPQARCYFKSWMDWRSITYRNSRQWRMQQIAYTCENGFRRVDGLYMIALGTYFLYSGVGDVFDITLSSGVTFRAVVGDIKSDRHTDPTNQFHISDGSVIEFVVDRDVMCSSVLSRGNISYAGFRGSVESIVRVPELFIAV